MKKTRKMEGEGDGNMTSLSTCGGAAAAVFITRLSGAGERVGSIVDCVEICMY